MIFKNNYELRKYLSSLSSTKYEQFNRKIVPSEKEMLGVTTPNLRLIAKNTVKHSLYDFLSILTDQTFEEIMLFGFAIGYAYVSLKDRCVLIDRYLDMVDNWAHIDSVVSTCKFIKKEKVEFLPQIEKYLQSDKEFTVRFALVCLLDYYITEDYLDYIFLSSKEEIVMTVQKASGELFEFEIYNDFGEDLGINFSDMLFGSAKRCTNKCIFCFIDQLPKGMRETMYFKDDDTRLSFLHGNYVTLTNMKKKDIEKLIKYRISPVNISVHTTNPKLRVKMLGNPKAADIIEQIEMLKTGRIEMNMQIVLCKGINDGEELISSLNKLSSYYPFVRSISVVPVGLTKFRGGLSPLSEITKEDSQKVIKEVSHLQETYLRKYGSRIVYLSDEFYINAGADLPKSEEYEDFPQIENGVGLISSMEEEFLDSLNEEHKQGFFGKNVIATGKLSYDFIKSLVEKAKKMYNNLDAEVCLIENDFFGRTVTVSGLICGKDIIKNLKGKDYDRLLITKSMLKADSDVFLDDVTVSELEEELNLKVVPVYNDGYDFLEKLLG